MPIRKVIEYIKEIRSELFYDTPDDEMTEKDLNHLCALNEAIYLIESYDKVLKSVTEIYKNN